MSIVDQAGTENSTPPPRRVRKSRTLTAEPDLREMLGEHGDLLSQARALIEAQGQSLNEMRDIIKNFQENGITIQTPEGAFTLTQGAVAKEEAAPALQDQYVVPGTFMDFIEIHAALAKSFRDRRPLLASGVQARYSDHAEPVLMIMRKGQFGTNDEMFNTALTLRIHDDEPYVDGDYMNFGKTVNMSSEQVSRCVSTILNAIRQEENPDG